MMNNGNMSDNQRLIIIQSRVLENEERLDRHHKVLLEGNGELPLVEKVRNLEAFSNNLRFWLRTVAVAIVLQTITFGAAALVYFFKLYPVLEKLSQP